MYDYPGMFLDCTKKHNVGMEMMCCQEAVGEEFTKEIKPNVKAPWKDTLLKADDDSTFLSEQKSETFHTLAMKGMILVKLARPDLESTFGFLSSRARASTQQDW